MDNQNKHCCPLCDQMFSVENGVSATEHLAKGIIKAVSEMQEKLGVDAFQCPRCGRLRMVPGKHQNAESRYARISICNKCGIDEALREEKSEPLQITAWHVVEYTLAYISKK
jgi:transcription elongation factor Elf1